MEDSYKKGQWNVECDQCGFQYKSGQLRKQWDGLMTCFGPSTNDCFEARHPQDYVRGKPDRQAPQWVRPPSVDYFLSTNEATADDL